MISKTKISILLLVAIACPSFAQEQYTYKYPKTYPWLNTAFDAFGKSKFMCWYNDYLIKKNYLSGKDKREYEQYSYPASPKLKKIVKEALHKAEVTKKQQQHIKIYENPEMIKFNIEGSVDLGQLTLASQLQYNHHSLAKIIALHEANHIRYNDAATEYFIDETKDSAPLFCGAITGGLTYGLSTYHILRKKIPTKKLLIPLCISTTLNGIIGTKIGNCLHSKLQKYHKIHVENRSDENSLDQNNCFKCTYKYSECTYEDHEKGQQIANRGYWMHDKANTKGKEQEKKGLLCEDCKDTPILDIPKQPQTLAEQIKSKLTSSFS